MQLKIFADYHSLSEQCAREIASFVRQKPDAVLCLAAGDTPRLAYTCLRRIAGNENMNFAKCSFIALDEWVGIPPESEGSCYFFLRENLFKPLAIAPPQIHVFNALSPDLSSECERMDKLIREKGGIDLMLVGVGMNGHIGFNEPGTPEDRYTHVAELDDTTQNVGQKYFKKRTKLRFGITLGLRHLLESRKAILIASGRKKADVVRLALEDPVTTKVPASVIRKHSHGLVMLDEEAASALNNGRAGTP